ncbi:MAG TPA: ABC transporter permease [Acidimicrobiia bacterium]|jgi:ribose transport system permease protein|nr:ABC transporter permease [Acidimicrobiia bacterium]
MTATTPSAIAAGSRRPWRRWVRRHGWTTGIWILFLALIAYYSTLIPSFGSFQVASIVNNGSPFVFLAAAQAVIVIAGGIDLGVGSMLVLTSVTAARLMEGQPFAATILIGIGILLAAAVLNSIVGWIITVSQVPDIVVTLGSLYVFQGMALWVLPNPGGGTSEGYRYLFTGSNTGIGANPWPAIAMISIAILAVAWWLGRTRRGLSLYAVGSDTTAAYLSGIRAARVKILSYAVGGSFAALAGLATTAIAGRGNATTFGGNLTLNSVAAIVLGGVALTGGIGSVIAVVPAGLILFFLNPILSAMGVDPNRAQIIQGLLIVIVMMVTGLLEWRRQRRS